MPKKELPLNKILPGDCVQILKDLPDSSVDLIFADPPYNLQLQNELIRPNQTLVDAVNDEWDKFSNFQEYDDFTRAWLAACQRVLKDDGTIWVIGSYHNIYRVGRIMMDLGFWVLNDVIWYKTNPMPNFRGTRFTNATETLIWAQKSQKQKRYTFNYHAMKNLNDEKQMPNVWQIPICNGSERIKEDGKKVHSTQKPEALLVRVISATSKVGDVVLDPFFGTGTTGAVAKKLRRNFIGIEREPRYIEVAQKRIDTISEVEQHDVHAFETKSKRDLPRVRFGRLLESGYLNPGQKLFSKQREHSAIIKADSHLSMGEKTGSIHQVAAVISGRDRVNGWEFWYFEGETKELVSIDSLRERYRKDHGLI